MLALATRTCWAGLAFALIRQVWTGFALRHQSLAFVETQLVAEGVETEEQSRLLRLLNCDEMQGFLSGKPVLKEIFETDSWL